MNNRTKLLTAAGSVLLLSGIGGALALWTDAATSASVLGNTGHLDLTLSAANIYDVSDLCAPITNAAAIATDPTTAPGFTAKGSNGICATITDLAAYKLVPGDKVRVVFPVSIDLAGKNIAAKLTVASNTAQVVVAPSDTDQGAWAYDAENPAHQYKLTQVGIFTGADAAAALAAGLAADTPGASVTAPTYYLPGDAQPLVAVYEFEFVNLSATANNGVLMGGNAAYGATVDANTYDPASAKAASDLMNQPITNVLNGLTFSLVQVRS